MSHPVHAFAKPARTPEQLLAHLQQRGLTVVDSAAAKSALNHIGYYRLLIYMRPLQQANKYFLANVTFDGVVSLYNFDRELRLLCIDAIERIEVALRAAIVNELGVAHGPHFHLESRHFENTSEFNEFLRTCASARYLAIEHYHSKYNHPSVPPIWAITEAISFGNLSRLFAGLHIANRKLVAKHFQLDELILVNWFKCLNVLRNMCAHHNRLWNAKLVVSKPKAAKKFAAELQQVDTFYSRAVIIAALLQAVETNSDWKQRLHALLQKFPRVPTAQMGFPSDWQQRRFWL